MLHVNGLLTLIKSTSASMISFKLAFEIISLAQSTSTQLLSTTAFAVVLQRISSSNCSPLTSASSLEIRIPSSVPQSVSLMITSCDESTSLLVRYPDSAVLNAVSAFPFLAPCAEIKYSIGVNHSRREDLIGSSIISHDGEATSHFIPAI